MRARELGIIIGSLPAGPNDAITDVPGVRVGFTTIIDEDHIRRCLFQSCPCLASEV